GRIPLAFFLRFRQLGRPVCSGRERRPDKQNANTGGMTMLYPILWRSNSGSPGDEVLTARREVDRLFDRFFGGSASQSLAAWTPVVDVHETTDAIRVSAELPGLSPDDLSVTVQNGVLTISG